MIKLSFKSFATRLSCYLISFTLIVFLTFMALFYTYTRETITSQAVQHTHGLLKNMATEIDGVLRTVETTMGQSVRFMEEHLSEPDSLKRLLETVVVCNDFIVGSGVAFRPGYYKEKGDYFMPYVFMHDQEPTTQVLGSKKYDYFCMDWYLIPSLLKKSYWSEPYYDEGGGNIIMATYALPLLDKEGEVYAVFIANISLSQFTDMVDRLKPYQSSYSFLLSRNGSYLTHPQREKIMNETIFSNAFEAGDMNLESVGHEMTEGHTGTAQFQSEGKDLYAFYTTIPNSGWSVCNICADEVILHRLSEVSRNMICIFIIGVILFFFISNYIIRRLVRPLEDFSHSARLIATGRFDVQLPEVSSHDEMKELHNSFVYMQKSLSDYVVQLQQTTAVKERIESELQIAQEIQMGMVPKTFPPFPDRNEVDLYATLLPAKEVGGDLYDFFLDGDKLYFTVGDVSGKGVPASLFMAITRSLFHTLLSNISSPKEIMNRMNRAISDSNESNMFVTLLVGILDVSSGVLKFCNAGHNPPVLIGSDGQAVFMPVKNNLFVGVVKDYDYTEEEIILMPETKLFLYTDGVTEAENEEHVFYSEERLLKVLSDHSAQNVRELIDSVMESVRSYVKEAIQSDDMTMLAIHYKPKSKGDGKEYNIE